MKSLVIVHVVKDLDRVSSGVSNAVIAGIDIAGVDVVVSNAVVVAAGLGDAGVAVLQARRCELF